MTHERKKQIAELVKDIGEYFKTTPKYQLENTMTYGDSLYEASKELFQWVEEDEKTFEEKVKEVVEKYSTKQP